MFAIAIFILLLPLFSKFLKFLFQACLSQNSNKFNSIVIQINNLHIVPKYINLCHIYFTNFNFTIPKLHQFQFNNAQTSPISTQQFSHIYSAFSNTNTQISTIPNFNFITDNSESLLHTAHNNTQNVVLKKKNKNVSTEPNIELKIRTTCNFIKEQIQYYLKLLSQ